MTRIQTSLFRAIIDGTFSEDLESGSPKAVVGILYPRAEAETHLDRSGRERTRRAEVTVFCDKTETTILAEGGTALFDCPGWFGQVGWHYFEVPEGTIVPESLTVERDGRMRHNRTGSLQGRRHRIVPMTRMTLAAYQAALDSLARNAIVRQIELAR